MDALNEFDRVVHEPNPDFVERTNVYRFMQRHDIDSVDELRERSTTDLEWFWDELIDTLDVGFYEPYDVVHDDSDAPQFSEWYKAGTINIAHNVVDRHVEHDAEERNKTACIWEGEDGDVREVSFHHLHRQSNKVANALTDLGVTMGDTVGVFMPMVPEAIATIYGILKVGAIVVPMFSGFGRDSLATRIEDAGCSVVVTADGFKRRGDTIPMKSTADAAIETTAAVEDVIVYDRLDGSVAMDDDRDHWWDELVTNQPGTFETVVLDSNQDAFLMYSSGTTGKPKGIRLSHAGFLVQTAKEIYFGFDHKPSDRFFWVTDVGWVMGSWEFVGNHAHGGTVFIYEGAPDYPTAGRLWDLIEKHELSTLGISPTLVRSLRREGGDLLAQYDLSSLRVLGSTGEPWDPEGWLWYYERVGNGELPILNIAGGTEVAGCFQMPLPIEPLKPGTLGGPALGMDIDIVDESGDSVVADNERGFLVARSSSPPMTKSLWSGDERYLEEYWATWDDVWDHGDWAKRDEDGFWFLLGRADDAINVAGRKVGPAEIEGALVDHPAVNQAAVVGVSDEVKGEDLVAYVIVEREQTESDSLRTELREHVATEVGKPYRPRDVLFVDEFPKTQSGKVIRRAIAEIYDEGDPGDLSSLANPEALEEIRNPR
jgi:acetyl-CoA synthetase